MEYELEHGAALSDTEKAEFDRICHQLTPTQMRYVSWRPYVDHDYEAAALAKTTPDAVKGWKQRGVPIDRAVQLMSKDGLIMSAEILRRALPRAAEVKVAGLESEDEKLAQDVATEIIERHHGKPEERRQDTITLIMDE